MPYREKYPNLSLQVFRAVLKGNRKKLLYADKHLQPHESEG